MSKKPLILANRKRQNDAAKERRHEKWERRRFVLEIAGVVVALIAAGILYGQQQAMRGQLDAMEADQRPWLKVDVSIPDHILLTSWAGTKSVNIPLRFSIENFGKTPAINVRAYPIIVRYPGNQRRKELAAPQRNTCDQGIAESDQDPVGGIPIFPTKRDKIETNIGALGGEIYQDGEPPIFAILGCVDYTYAGTKHGQTGFRYLLGSSRNGSVIGIPFVEGNPIQVDEPISEELLKGGYPKEPPKTARIPIGELIFRPEDSGNYAK